MHMNDDTVPDGGKSIGLYGGRTPSGGLKVLSFGLTLAMALGSQARTYEVDGIEWSYQKQSSGVEIKGEDRGAPAIDRNTKGFVSVPSKLGTFSVVSI